MVAQSDHARKPFAGLMIIQKLRTTKKRRRLHNCKHDSH